ncbi:hypothetical protein VC83_07561 [Pseudogymnoascus destructans]|uniref:BSD domain-containing protein n=2 Tax=Pseudogymnoascus destructans TaxID=655981 RepID=L8GBV2_PSED2|nr:uncharacterized protein VC83_07561 [Pseudogymnoascus destructans]ELR10108.1 hypothetical protein GMDG_04508 [Pseudogymnoascus destructans 20631-21]OAF55514.1 hypothetical protein VC83_07561 [Pseudogymnoascus destructans]
MDAYDHIQESALAPEGASAGDNNNGGNGEGKQMAQNTLNADFQDAYKAISSSPWGARLGGFLGSVVKQGEHVYKEASQELSAVGQEATKGLADLRSSLVGQTKKSEASIDDTTAKDGETPAADMPSEGVLARLRTEAAKRLKDIERAEDAADEALLRFGTGLRDFLREAVSIAPAGTEEGGQEGGFESKDAAGKRVIHSTRFEAQMHAIHCNAESFTKDSEGEEWSEWRKEFDAEGRTGEISADLERFGELRGMMESLVPREIKYKDFWARYYFLRHSIETAEKRRKELLKGAAADAEEEVGWDEDSDDEAATASASASAATKNKPTSSVASSQTINPPATASRDDSRLDPADAKRQTSADGRSVADSEASYDVVGARSGVPSAAPGSPRQEGKKGEESDEDWE